MHDPYSKNDLLGGSEEPFLPPFSSQAPYRRPRRRRRRRRSTPGWLAVLLSVCVLVAVILVIRAFLPAERGEKSPAPTAAYPTPPLPSASVAPTAAREPQPAQTETAPPSADPAPAVDGDEWFADAVFIGDSRVAGLRLYSGITAKTTFLDHTGLSIYAIANGKEVFPRGEKKVSVLDALAEEKYGKVYISVGVNELGYFDPSGFATAYGKVLDAIRECQPDATVYVQSLIPVNEAKCREKGMPDYITNEGVTNYNEALKTVCEEKDVILLGIPEDLLDGNGEVQEELTTDGVHFKKEGYVRWLEYLTGHTGSEEETGQ